MPRQEISMEEWREIAEEVSETEEQLQALLRLLSCKVPKSVWYDDFSEANDALTELKSVLEDRMAEEHPQDWETSVFYEDKP